MKYLGDGFLRSVALISALQFGCLEGNRTTSENVKYGAIYSAVACCT